MAGNMVRRFLIVVGTIGLGMVACNGTTTPALGPTTAVISPPPSPIIVTTAPDCTGRLFATYPLTVADNGRSYRMVRCQYLRILLLHAAQDECGWSGVETSDPHVMAIAPLPLPAQPAGATNEVYESAGPGTASLSSKLLCAGAAVGQHWSITIEVSG